MRISRKLLGAAAAGAAVALALTGCAGGADEPSAEAPESEYEDVIDVNFGYIPDFNGTSLLAIAEDQGLWDK